MFMIFGNEPYFYGSEKEFNTRRDAETWMNCAYSAEEIEELELEVFDLEQED